MKLIITFFLLSLISLNLGSRLGRTEKTERKIKKTHKSKTLDDGGSWDKGFNCPGIQVNNGNGNFNNEGSGIFQAKNMEKPTAQIDKNGWVFNFGNKKPGNNLAKFFVSVGGTNYSLPYRFITRKPTWTNPAGNNKYIDISVTNDSGNSSTVRIILPYALFSSYIDENEMTKICGFALANANSQREEIKNLKTDAIKQASYIATSQPVLQAAQSNQNVLEENQKKIDQFSAQITEQTKLKEDADASYSKMNVQYDEIKLAVEEANSKLNQLSLEYDENLKKIKEFENKKTASAEDLAKMGKEVEDSKNKFIAEADNILRSAPQRSIEVSDARLQNDKLNVKGVTDDLNKIVPLV